MRQIVTAYFGKNLRLFG